MVLKHAQSSSRPLAFVTADMGFWETDKPKAQILQDIDAQKVDVRLYKDLGEFTKDNALVSETVTDSWIQTHIKETAIEETILNSLREHLKQTRRVSGDITEITATRISFAGGSLYKVDAKT